MALQCVWCGEKLLEEAQLLNHILKKHAPITLTPSSTDDAMVSYKTESSGRASAAVLTRTTQLEVLPNYSFLNRFIQSEPIRIPAAASIRKAGPGAKVTPPYVSTLPKGDIDIVKCGECNKRKRAVQLQDGPPAKYICHRVGHAHDETAVKQWLTQQVIEEADHPACQSPNVEPCANVMQRPDKTLYYRELRGVPMSDIRESKCFSISLDYREKTGIAEQFLDRPNENYVGQTKGVGEVAYYKKGPGIYIFSLILKEHFYDEATFETLQLCLNDLARLCSLLGVKRLSIPHLLGDLKWRKVKECLLIDTEWDDSMELTVYYEY